MGFIEDEVELQRRAEAARKEVAELADAGKAAYGAAQKLIEEDKSHAAEDNKAIVALLDNLPPMDLEQYLGIVAKHSGYTPRIVLYSRVALYSSLKAERLLEQDQELRDKLDEKGIKLFVKHSWDSGDGGGGDYYEPMELCHPRKMFLGDEIKPRTGFLSLTPITEPQDPGIGICFEKSLTTKRYRGTSLLRHTSSVLYVRLTPPATAFLTGHGEKVFVTSLEAFDKGLKEAFKFRHTKKTLEFRSDPVTHSNG